MNFKKLFIESKIDGELVAKNIFNMKNLLFMSCIMFHLARSGIAITAGNINANAQRQQTKKPVSQLTIIETK